MKRYNAVRGGVYDNSVIVEENDGDWVWYEDVEQLEDINAELLLALEKALDESGCDGDLCAHEWHDLARAAIAKAKGEGV